MVHPEQISNLPGVLAVIDRMLAVAVWDRTLLGGPRTPSPIPDEPQARCLPFPRMTVFFSGHKQHVFSRCGERVDVDAQSGQVLHWTTTGWDLDCWHARKACHFGGLVFRPECLRVVEVDFPGGPPPIGNARSAYHTRIPLGGAALQLLAALETLAVSGPSADRQSAVGSLAKALVVLARAHVVEDLSGIPLGNALRTWQEVLQFIAERLADRLSRTMVAHALGLHPNYLSTLCTRQGGSSFQATVERLRLERAKALLAAEPDLAVSEIAIRCGFADAGYFTRVFRRRIGTSPRRYALSGVRCELPESRSAGQGPGPG